MDDGVKFAAALVLLILLSTALTAASDEIASEDFVDGVYIEDGASADKNQLSGLVDEAQSLGLDLSVAVLNRASSSAVNLAKDIAADTLGTVMVFTPLRYGVSSDELSQGRLDDALDQARGALESADVVAGVRAFIDAATEEPEGSSTNWPVLIALGVLLLVAIAFVGRSIERRASADRREQALTRTWAAQRKRADALSSPILDLSTRVDLLDDLEVTATYREATGLFERVRHRIERPANPEGADEVGKDLDRLTELVARIKRAVKATPRSPLER